MLLNIRKHKKNKAMVRFTLKKGIALDRAGEHQAALMCYDHVLQMDPENPMAWSFKAGALLKLEKIREARDAYQKFAKYAKAEHADYAVQANQLIRDIDDILKKDKLSA